MGQRLGLAHGRVFGAVREGDRSGYVKVFWPDGGHRVIFFEVGTPAY